MATACRQQPPAAQNLSPELERLKLKPSILPDNPFSEPLVSAPHFDVPRDPAHPRVPLRMIIRGLCAYHIHPEGVDLLLMDTRVLPVEEGQGPMPIHTGKFTVEDRYTEAQGKPDSPENGVVEDHDAKHEAIRVWNIRGSRAEFVTDPPLDDVPIEWVEREDEYPWASKRWQLNFDDVFPGGQGHFKDNIWNDGDPSVAAIIRLKRGRLESALPAVRYGNTAVWTVHQQDTGGYWRQALSDTVLYSLDLPVGVTKVTLTRSPLKGYKPVPGEDEDPPTTTPIVLNGPMPGINPELFLPCGIGHEPPLGHAVHTNTLVHNRVFFDLYTNAPPYKKRVFPDMHRQWVDRGVGREARSYFWDVIVDPKTRELKRNVCDPNCNGVVIGAGPSGRKMTPKGA